MRFTAITFVLAALPGVAHAQMKAEPGAMDTTHIAGTIASVCSVEAVTTKVRIQLNGQTQDITDVVYTCNSPNSITRRVSSLHGGRLLRGRQSVPYLISQTGSQDVAFAPVSLSSPLVTELTPSAGLVNGVTGQLRLAIPVLPRDLVAGEYVDTVTIDIVPN